MNLAIILGACWTSHTYSEHHQGDNEKPFQLLYLHLMPANLVHHDHGHHDHDHHHHPEYPHADHPLGPRSMKGG